MRGAFIFLSVMGLTGLQAWAAEPNSSHALAVAKMIELFLADHPSFGAQPAKAICHMRPRMQGLGVEAEILALFPCNKFGIRSVEVLGGRHIIVRLEAYHNRQQAEIEARAILVGELERDGTKLWFSYASEECPKSGNCSSDNYHHLLWDHEVRSDSIVEFRIRRMPMGNPMGAHRHKFVIDLENRKIDGPAGFLTKPKFPVRMPQRRPPPPAVIYPPVTFFTDSSCTIVLAGSTDSTAADR